MAGALDFMGYGGGIPGIGDMTPAAGMFGKPGGLEALKAILAKIQASEAPQAAPAPEGVPVDPSMSGSAQARAAIMARLRDAAQPPAPPAVNPAGYAGVPQVSYPGANAFDPPAPPVDQAAAALAAREAAAKRLQGQVGPMPARPGIANLIPGAGAGGPSAVDPSTVQAPPAPPPLDLPEGALNPAAPFGSLAPPGLSGGVEPGVNSPKVPTVPVGMTPGLAQPMAGRASPPQQPAPQPLAPPTPDGNPPPGLFDRVTGFLGKNSNALTALGTGLLSGNGWGQGLARGFAGMNQGVEADKQAAAQNVTAEILQQKLGVSGAEARAIATNPALMRQVLPQIYAQPTFEKVKNADGTEAFVLLDPSKGTITNPKAGRSAGTQRVIDGRTFTFRGGKWFEEK